jgi:hypothetical protein
MRMATGDQQFTDHQGGPPPYRPLSGAAVTSLVLALLAAIPAFIGLWWIMGLPVLVALLAWPGVSSGRRRGKVLLWFSLLLSVGIGATTYWMQGVLAKQIDEGVSPLIVALDKDDRTTLEKWTLETVDRPATFDRWKARLDAVRKDAGPWSGSLRLDRGWTGVMMRLLMPPGGWKVEPVGATSVEIGKALWFCMPHSRADVCSLSWASRKFEEAHKELWSRLIGGRRASAAKDGRRTPRVLRDVRVFRVPN